MFLKKRIENKDLTMKWNFMAVKVIYMKRVITDMPYITGQYNLSLV